MRNVETCPVLSQSTIQHFTFRKHVRYVINLYLSCILTEQDFSSFVRNVNDEFLKLRISLLLLQQQQDDTSEFTADHRSATTLNTFNC
jgi:hypothetical protein